MAKNLFIIALVAGLIASFVFNRKQEQKQQPDVASTVQTNAPQQTSSEVAGQQSGASNNLRFRVAAVTLK